MFALIQRDEAKHAAFGVHYVREYLHKADPKARIAFARFWLKRIVEELGDPYVANLAMQVGEWLREAGVRPYDELARRMLREQQALRERERGQLVRGDYVPQVLLLSRNVGLLAPDMLDALGLGNDPLMLGALNGSSGSGPGVDSCRAGIQQLKSEES